MIKLLRVKKFNHKIAGKLYRPYVWTPGVSGSRGLNRMFKRKAETETYGAAVAARFNRWLENAGKG